MTEHSPTCNRREQWYWQYNIVLDWYYPRIGDTAFVLYALLCRMGQGNARESFPSLPTLADRLRKGERTIQMALRVLERYRLIAVTKRVVEVDGHRRQSSNLYTVLQPEMHPTDEMFGPAGPVMDTETPITVPEAVPDAIPEAPEIAPEEMARREDHATRAVPQEAVHAAEAARPLPLTPPPDAMPVDAQFAAFCRANGIEDPAAMIARFLEAMRRTGARRNDWSEALIAWCRNQLSRTRQRQPGQQGQCGRPGYQKRGGYGRRDPQRPAETPKAPAVSRPGNTSGEDVIREMQRLRRQAGSPGQERRF